MTNLSLSSSRIGKKMYSSELSSELSATAAGAFCFFGLLVGGSRAESLKWSASNC